MQTVGVNSLGSAAPLSQGPKPSLLRGGKWLLTLLLAWLLSQLFWQLVAPLPLALPPINQGSAAIGNQTSKFSAAEFHLFGVVGMEPVAEVPAQVSAPDTRLRLDLLGVTKGPTNDSSSAIIAPRGSEGEFYRVGDVVQGNVRLAAVHQDRVILDTNGRLETLKFEDRSTAGIETRVVNKPEPAPNSQSLRDRLNQVRTPTQFLEMLSTGADDPQKMMDELGIESVGAGQGYRVKPKSMLAALQLRPGDIVLSVNGQGLGDPQTDQMLLSQVSQENSVRIEVQRGNNRFVVNHALNNE